MWSAFGLSINDLMLFHKIKCSPVCHNSNFMRHILWVIIHLRPGNVIEKAIVSFEFLIDIHADDSEFTLLGQAGPAARQIIRRANHQLFRSLSRYSGFDFENYFSYKLIPWIISKSTKADTLRIRTEYYELTTSKSLDLTSFVMIISFIFTLLM